MKQIQRQESKSDNTVVNTYSVAAKRAESYGDIAHRDKICDLGIKEYYLRLMRTNSETVKRSTSERFEERANIYKEIAELYGIKGERGLQVVCMRQSELAFRDAQALADAKRCAD